MEWFDSLAPLLRFFWITAGVSSLIFAIQMIMVFMGMDTSDGSDVDLHGGMNEESPLQFLSIRNLVNFFLGFGWGGVCFYDTFSSQVAVIICASITGIVFVLLFFALIKQFLKLDKDNTFKINEIQNKVADVYLVIPGENTGKGKIQVSVRGAVHEIEAITTGERLPTGSKVRVIEVIDNQIALVTKL